MRCQRGSLCMHVVVYSPRVVIRPRLCACKIDFIESFHRKYQRVCDERGMEVVQTRFAPTVLALDSRLAASDAPELQTPSDTSGNEFIVLEKSPKIRRICDGGWGISTGIE